ncbi:MAG: enoyl-CoA hydratase/isomerase family protein [Ardenticatenia bacterium]|nr:enoyl-CoA hydratase/isomerase family protein [Ardenticatenia bacterium]
MKTYTEIVFDRKWHDHTALLAINRPHEYNSYTLTTLREMVSAIEEAMWDDDIQFIVLTGVGDKAFCTGGNVHEYAEEYTRKAADFWKWGEIYGRVFDMIMHCGKPVIARVNGAVAGGGFEFVAACDLAIAADHARFISPGPRVGMTSVGGLSQWLPLHIGVKRTAEIVMLSTEIDARTALEWGVVNAVVPLEELDNTVHEFLERMLSLSPSSLWYFKVHLNWWRDLVWRLTWEHAKAWFSLNIGSVEPSEGLWAFKERRPSRMREIRDRIGDGMDPRYPFGPLMKRCDACDAEFLPEHSKFCLNCGTAL